MIVLALLAAAGLACNLGNVSGAGGGSNLDASVAVSPDTEPIRVALTLDQSHSASAEIGPAGGTLKATGGDGSTFTLEVPPDALSLAVKINMTPILSMDGIPWKSEGLVAVQLEPDGQTFAAPVKLIIQPAEDIPIGEIVPVGATGPDKDLYMPMVDPGSSGLTLDLEHFSSAGASKGLLADTEPWRQRLGGDVETRLSSVASEELMTILQAGARGEDTAKALDDLWGWLIPTWKQYVLDPRLAASKDSCAEARLAIETARSMEALMARWHRSEDIGIHWADLYPGTAQICLQEEYELCRDQHIIHRILDVLVDTERQSTLAGISTTVTGELPSNPTEMDQILAQGWDLARKCLTFELQFESTVDMGTGDGSFTSSVESTVEIQLDPSTALFDENGQRTSGLTGTADLTNTDYEFRPNHCSATGITGGGTFQVLSLNWTSAPPDDFYPYGHVTAIHLTYDPGNTSESAKVNCTGAAEVTLPPAPMWTMAYEALHLDELGSTSGAGPAPSIPDLGSLLGGSGLSGIPGLPGGSVIPGTDSQGASGSSASNSGSGMSFTATEWAVRGGELFAQKEWQTSVTMTTKGTEEGSFKLYHKPQ